VLLSAGGSVSVYNIHVELVVMCRRKRGERAADIAHAIQIPEMRIHTISKGVRKLKQMLLTCQTP
jgi:hypothetical protein